MYDLKGLKEWLGAGSINLFGRPFSGKDTQGHRLAKLLDAALIGGGDILRTSGPQHVKDIIDKGNLAPTDDFLATILPYLSRKELKNRPLILSSIGRWLGEEEPVLQAANAAGHPIKAVIALTIPESAVHERWESARHLNTRGDRKDDDAKHIDTRLREYREKTIPVIRLFRERQMLVEVDGTQQPDQVTRDILRQLVKLSQD